MSSKTVNRCICHNHSFKEIKQYAGENNLDSLEQLQASKFCSCGCGLCAPYVELMLATGETAFEPGAFYRKKKENKS